MRSLPDGVAPYRRTPSFTSETVPPTLLRDHATKAGVWGLIQVVRGALIYRISKTREEHRLVPGTHGVVEPEVLHSVELLEDAEFFVEFWKEAGD